MTAPQDAPVEARTGLEPWKIKELPVAPQPRGLQWINVVGPGVIVLGAAIGSGEFLIGPASFVRYGLTLLWITTIAATLQTIFNTELMRYTLATGEPAFTGFMRTRPSAQFWAWFYATCYLLSVGWPAWAGAAAGAFFFLFTGRVASAADAGIVYALGIGAFFVCVLILLVGRRIERTLEILNWVLVGTILTGLSVLAIALVAPETWLKGVAGFIGYDPTQSTFRFLPSGGDFFLLGALAGFSGAGGLINVTLSNWARDKGYGMSAHSGYIPAALGGERTELAHTGATFVPNAESMARWHGWWRIVRADQWGVFFVGALLGMLLPALLYVTFVPAGSDIRGFGIAAVLADAVGTRGAAVAAIVVAIMGAWILFKTQLDILDGTVRAVTDLLWSGSKRLRAMRGMDVRRVYYAVLAVAVIWGVLALRLAQPIFLLQLSANFHGVMFVVAGLHLLYVNTRLLPVALRPSLGKRLGLVALVVFYGTVVVFWLRGLLT
ncbi:MAG TPA: Nramp family divalent metal transporter [Gemmatimonadaceae bacterium]|nr:Nramp family divalent metal transporter [Gemmatimonadaceae bacterium]